HALILMPNQAMAAASAARAMPATLRMRARGLLVGAALNSIWPSWSSPCAGCTEGPEIATTAVRGTKIGLVLEPESGGTPLCSVVITERPPGPVVRIR